MDLHDVARQFDNLVCCDGYTGKYAFCAQLGLYDDNKRDSETAERRTISAGVDVVIPARRVVSAAGTRFIVGHANPDDYRGRTIRVGYVVHEATFLSRVRTLAQVCLGLLGFTAYAGRAWVKDLSYSQEASQQNPQHHIHYARSEAIANDLVVTFDDRLHIVRSTVRGSGGTIVASCEELAEPTIEAATLNTGTYNALTDTTVTTPLSITVVRMRWQALFTYRNAAAPKFQAGDIQIAIAKASATPPPGATLALSDGLWRLQSVDDEGSVWLCRATRHG